MDERVTSPPLGDDACLVDALTAVVAIPVRNERERIGDCLRALAAQIGLEPGSLGVLLFLNNCIDGTADAIKLILPEIPWSVRVIEVTDERATAGWARRCAMDAAAAWFAESGVADGVILTSDADSQVGADWVARNLRHITSGADAVAGRITLDEAEAALLPASLHARGRLEATYETLLTEIGARLDPDPTNPWPCHWTRSGATLAVRRSAYHAVDGMPPLVNGEDRAFVEALRSADFVVRHAMDVVVVTSGRLDGRAEGGTAETIKLRCVVPDSLCDDRLERLSGAVRRILWRRRLRRVHVGGGMARTWTWAPLLAIPAAKARELAGIPNFARAHAGVEGISPRLAYKPLPPSRLPGQIRLARLLVSVLRVLARPGRVRRRADTLPFAAGGAPEQTQPTLP